MKTGKEVGKLKEEPEVSLKEEQKNGDYDERRKHPRKDMQLPVVVSIPRRRKLKVQSLNISEGGIAILLPEPLTLQEVYPIVLYLDKSAAPIKTTGRIMWQREGKGSPFVAGVQFIDIRREDVDRIFMKLHFNAEVYL
jgi:c-di-GMP-binding flagellar brake protein YcgR